jgi:hypothetical protein
MLNTHCFVGYFTNLWQYPTMWIYHTQKLYGEHINDGSGSKRYIRHFCYSRYAELVENPIMYSKPDYTTLM